MQKRVKSYITEKELDFHFIIKYSERGKSKIFLSISFLFPYFWKICHDKAVYYTVLAEPTT